MGANRGSRSPIGCRNRLSRIRESGDCADELPQAMEYRDKAYVLHLVPGPRPHRQFREGRTRERFSLRSVSRSARTLPCAMPTASLAWSSIWRIARRPHGATYWTLASARTRPRKYGPRKLECSDRLFGPEVLIVHVPARRTSDLAHGRVQVRPERRYRSQVGNHPAGLNRGVSLKI